MKHIHTLCKFVMILIVLVAMYNIMFIGINLSAQAHSVLDYFATIIIDSLLLLFEIVVGLWLIELYKTEYNDKSF